MERDNEEGLEIHTKATRFSTLRIKEDCFSVRTLQKKPKNELNDNKDIKYHFYFPEKLICQNKNPNENKRRLIKNAAKKKLHFM